MSSGAYREEPYWTYYNQESDELPSGAFLVKTRSLDSLGRGNILRSLGMGSEWGGDKAGSNWRFVGGSPKRGGGLDSLGRGNILRRVNYDDEISNFIHSSSPLEGRNAFLRSLDSLGKGNILKRSVRTIPSTQQQHGYGMSESSDSTKFSSSTQNQTSTACLMNVLASTLDKEQQLSMHAWNAFYDLVCYTIVTERGPANKKMDSLAGDVFGMSKRFDSISGATFGTQKRNFDEIDRNGFGAFVKRTYGNRPGYYKRNFDEIDRTGFGAFVKRSV